ncbi:hypothetical protein [Stenotrophomonas maltophilia]|uniref:hypothetical protein n=1 Tax=Stenotrophomonas maltophilia TaxID=40324 RepID=UPI001F53DE23|nr:hypothetical protein [Stenotrophomonas maltophilia]MCI1058805.1 hypothetical protein [Stenotrophomonas maltophilia]MCI1062272.1 hypothetical protein [Stenotrophomonas maltophilia]MCI1079765.1 hypothetical protein [Stenotrophomonas maltophilia]MCI1082914.1 hypothetical protein [Stenotrophomonas maltophilia]MCI1095237.1 hypothetical protein [Stenotrophomonas maltophilia]
MFKYAVRVEGDGREVVATLVDWPEVTVTCTAGPPHALREKLLQEIAACMRNRSWIPVPKAKPLTSFYVQLSTSESLKVLVLNELHASGVDVRFVARDLGVSESEVIRAVDLGRSTDVDLLSEMLTVMGRRLLAYTSSI